MRTLSQGCSVWSADDSGGPHEQMEDPGRGIPISIIEAAKAADAFADADAAAALQAMIALQGSGPRSSGILQQCHHAPESVATVPQAQNAQPSDADDNAEAADIIHAHHPNPESFPCSRAKKMRLLSAVYLSPAAKCSAGMH